MRENDKENTHETVRQDLRALRTYREKCRGGLEQLLPPPPPPPGLIRVKCLKTDARDIGTWFHDHLLPTHPQDLHMQSANLSDIVSHCWRLPEITQCEQNCDAMDINRSKLPKIASQRKVLPMLKKFVIAAEMADDFQFHGNKHLWRHCYWDQHASIRC